MANDQRRILVVAPTLTIANRLSAWLSEAGYEVTIARTFRAAIAHLGTTPDVVITELRLHDYNGLHLTLRARERGIPSAVIGDHDAVFEEDARQLGATYVTADTVNRDDILRLAQNLFAAVRTSPRNVPSGELPLTEYVAGGKTLASADLGWATSPASHGGVPSLRRPTLH